MIKVEMFELCNTVNGTLNPGGFAESEVNSHLTEIQNNGGEVLDVSFFEYRPFDIAGVWCVIKYDDHQRGYRCGKKSKEEK